MDRNQFRKKYSVFGSFEHTHTHIYIYALHYIYTIVVNDSRGGTESSVAQSAKDLCIGRHYLKHTAPQQCSQTATDSVKTNLTQLPGSCPKDLFGTTEVQHPPGTQLCITGGRCL